MCVNIEDVSVKPHKVHPGSLRGLFSVQWAVIDRGSGSLGMNRTLHASLEVAVFPTR